jgi:hypothetical protein
MPGEQPAEKRFPPATRDYLARVAVAVVFYLILFGWKALKDWALQQLPEGWVTRWSYVPAITFILFFFAAGMFQLRERRRKLYGYLEVGIGVATVVAVLIDFHDHMGAFALAGACYVIVRGMDNEQEGRKKEKSARLREAITAAFEAKNLPLTAIEAARLKAITDPGYLEELAAALEPAQEEARRRTAVTALLLGRAPEEIEHAVGQFK